MFALNTEEFGRFLEHRAGVSEEKCPHYVDMVQRLLARAPTEADPVSPFIVRRFLAELGRRGEDVEPAREAARWFAVYRDAVGGWDEVVAEVRRVMAVRRLSVRTEESYVGWIKRFRLFSNHRPPGELGSVDVEAFLSHLAVEAGVAASTQNQALSALLFLYRNVLGKELDVADAVRARVRKRIPVVLSRDEVRVVLRNMPYPWDLMCRVIYGGGLRLQECLELRVKDLDFDRGIVTVRAGKGQKDRQTVLPAALENDLRNHLAMVRAIHEADRAANVPGVDLPAALRRKYPGAETSWPWFWVFPSSSLSVEPRTRVVRRHHHQNAAGVRVRRT